MADNKKYDFSKEIAELKKIKNQLNEIKEENKEDRRQIESLRKES